MSDVTEILSQIESGDPVAAEGLLPLVYDELRKLAAARLGQEKPGQTLQATALVHEAYLRLVGRQDSPSWDGQGHFFATAAEAMRRILIERARRAHRVRHGGRRNREELNVIEPAIAAPLDEVDLLALNEALDRLEFASQRRAQLSSCGTLPAFRCRKRPNCSGSPSRPPRPTGPTRRPGKWKKHNNHWGFCRSISHWLSQFEEPTPMNESQIFAQASTSQFSVGFDTAEASARMHMVAADFNADGKQDLITVGNSFSGSGYEANVLLGKGDSSFNTALAIATPVDSPIFTVADFNRDGYADVAVIRSVISVSYLDLLLNDKAVGN
jgi:RNA polymerase sigma factor (TIGR02999 family)